jgi:nitrous oxidase accessory protein NosD
MMTLPHRLTGGGLRKRQMLMRKDKVAHLRPGASLGVAGAIAGLVMSFAITAPFPAFAGAENHYDGNNAARVSGYIKPCFGMLLDVQMRTCGGRRHYRESGHLYGYHGGRYDATINCDTAPRGHVENVVERIRSGGVLYLKAKNRSCVASLDIKKSITIVGTGYSPRDIPVLVAPDGQSCIRIAPTAEKVIIKNAYISSPRGDQTACIEASGSELTLQNSQIRYQGDAAAIHLSGGRLNITESSHIIAKTRSVAVAINNGEFFAENSEIATTAGGIYGVLSGDSQVNGLSVQQLADWRGFQRGEGAIGIELKLDSANSILSMMDTKVRYFARGIHLDGAGEALLAHSLVEHSDHGIVASLNRVRVIENTVIASEIGIDVVDGTAFVGNNRVARVRTAGILASSTGEIRAVDNRIEADQDGCKTLKWGNVPPSERVCTPWYEGSEFDVPGDARDQYLFDQYWPRENVVASAPVSTTPTAARAADPIRN